MGNTRSKAEKLRKKIVGVSEDQDAFFDQLWVYWQKIDTELTRLGQDEDDILKRDAAIPNELDNAVDSALEDQSWLIEEMLRVRSKKPSDALIKLKISLEDMYPGKVKIDILPPNERLLHQAVRELVGL